MNTTISEIFTNDSIIIITCCSPKQIKTSKYLILAKQFDLRDWFQLAVVSSLISNLTSFELCSRASHSFCFILPMYLLSAGPSWWSCKPITALRSPKMQLNYWDSSCLLFALMDAFPFATVGSLPSLVFLFSNSSVPLSSGVSLPSLVFLRRKFFLWWRK